MDGDKRMEVLNRLEAGEIDAEEAIQVLGETETLEEEGVSEAMPTSSPWTRTWWLIPFSLGIAGTAAGLALSQLGGWWWVCAGPLLLVSLIVVITATATSQSPWVHLRIRTGAQGGYRRINFHLPLPLRLTAWGLRTFGGKLSSLDNTAIDELIMSFEDEITRESQIFIEVNDEDDGEQVEVFMG